MLVVSFSVEEKDKLVEELKSCEKYIHQAADKAPLLDVPVFYKHLQASTVQITIYFLLGLDFWLLCWYRQL